MNRTMNSLSFHLTWTAKENPEEPKPEEHPAAPRPGELCPRCRQARLDYDGVLNLVCPRCGYTATGCFT